MKKIFFLFLLSVFVNIYSQNFKSGDVLLEPSFIRLRLRVSLGDCLLQTSAKIKHKKEYEQYQFFEGVVFHFKRITFVPSFGVGIGNRASFLIHASLKYKNYKYELKMNYHSNMKENYLTSSFLYRIHPYIKLGVYLKKDNFGPRLDIFTKKHKLGFRIFYLNNRIICGLKIKF